VDFCSLHSCEGFQVGVILKMASNRSTEHQNNTQRITFVLGSGNRGRTVHKVKIVPFNAQTTSDEQARADQQQKEKLMKEQTGI